MSRRMLLASNLLGFREVSGEHPVASSLDIDWLLSHPSTLLWADPLFMAESDFQHVHGLPGSGTEAETESLRLFFDSMRDEGVIQPIDPGAILTPEAETFVSQQVEADEATFGGTGARDEQHEGPVDYARIELAGNRYCAVIIQGIYGTLVTARLLDATAIMDSPRLMFCRDRFSAMAERPDVGHEVDAINAVYDVFLPDVPTMGDYRVFCGVRDTCVHGCECDKDAKANTLRLVDDILKLRDSPDLKSLARYVDQKLPEVGYDDTALLSAMRADLRKMQKRILDVVPRVQSVSRLALYASIPAYLAAIGGKPGLLTLAPPALVAFSRALGSYGEKIEKEYRWTAAIGEHVDYEALASRMQG
ncbi:MAG: hypothetical protein WBJ62_01985 [Coriobacteriia bacterium]